MYMYIHEHEHVCIYIYIYIYITKDGDAADFYRRREADEDAYDVSDHPIIYTGNITHEHKNECSTIYRMSDVAYLPDMACHNSYVACMSCHSIYYTVISHMLSYNITSYHIIEYLCIAC